jgi:pyridoxamine 5'-phosphate oxidase
MIDSLFEPAPDFDQPIAVLKHCHDRIRKQLGTMQKLLAHLSKSGADVEAQQGAKAILKYFNGAAGNHHADEEHDLLPMLQQTAQGEDETLLNQLVPEIMNEHQQMDKAWEVLDRQLQHIAAGESSELSEEAVNRFAESYRKHMDKEEAHIAPMAKRIFSNAQMAQLGNAMRTRRGIV